MFTLKNIVYDLYTYMYSSVCEYIIIMYICWHVIPNTAVKYDNHLVLDSFDPKLLYVCNSLIYLSRETLFYWRHTQNRNIFLFPPRLWQSWELCFTPRQYIYYIVLFHIQDDILLDFFSLFYLLFYFLFFLYFTDHKKIDFMNVRKEINKNGIS